ncbi:hypothetical protein N476_24805 [Pseudoalteromonas luteoviolacea H33]|uniref:DUF3325 domain-containing protein n=1 Tax=Pseudoalteromonas luteoviolacea H33 TaxID=1365251 RepID=A0A162A8N2_9GAMM|nr:hypothetical protein N476_24805 [Pseudoalteromonas luteoviolacea H33]KZN76903.1 hypothetical protein N477_14095 [Pseudoalteromonas luteoviolacea H33-S]
MVLLISTGAIFSYLSNRHQRLLKKPLSKTYQKMGYGLFAMAILVGVFNFVGSAGVFIWILILMAALFCFPFIALFIKRN